MSSTCLEHEHTLPLNNAAYVVYRWHVKNYTIPVNKTVLLKMSSRVRNM